MKRFFTDYGMLFVLLLLCALFSVLTLAEQRPSGASGGRQTARDRAADLAAGSRVLIATRDSGEDRQFAEAAAEVFAARGLEVVGRVHGSPADARSTLERLAGQGARLDAVLCTPATEVWPVWRDFSNRFPAYAAVPVLAPRSYRWPNFLKRDNLVNVANQIAVIAIVAIGMTMVIITAGIDLSVGSLIALSAVAAALLIRDLGGGTEASGAAMVLAGLAAVLLCAAVGLFTGGMITLFGIPPFIVTLAMMLVASGLAYLLSGGEAIYQVPDTFVGLGRGTWGIVPVSVVLMAGLYLLAHVVMSRMTLGRHIYAVGGNPEAARLSGVPVKRVTTFVYVVCGALAGLGGVVTASQLKSGSATYGLMYELYVIAAVVVGGTSLAGGQGKILGTLIGAFIIGVIQNGMNLTGVESYTQKVVLGLVILGAVLLDTVKKQGHIQRVAARLARR